MLLECLKNENKYQNEFYVQWNMICYVVFLYLVRGDLRTTRLPRLVLDEVGSVYATLVWWKQCIVRGYTVSTIETRGGTDMDFSEIYTRGTSTFMRLSMKFRWAFTRITRTENLSRTQANAQSFLKNPTAEVTIWISMKFCFTTGVCYWWEDHTSLVLFVYVRYSGRWLFSYYFKHLDSL